MSDFDDIMKDVAAAVDATESSAGTTEPPADKTGAAPPSGAEESPPSSASEGERPRDEQGRFAPKETAKAPAEDKQELSAPETGLPGQQKPAQAKQVTPPTHWKGDGKINWAKVHPAVQQAIADDHANFSKTQTELQQLRAAIGDERAQVLAASYGSVGQGLQNLFALSDFATKNPAGFIQYFANQRGIDLTRIVGQGTGQGQPDPTQQPNPLEQVVNELRTEIAQLKGSRTQAEQTQVQSEIERFSSDPANPYFNDVRADMAALVKAGAAQGLKDAYEKACWARPEIRTALIAQEREKAAAADAAKVESAKAKQVSIAGSPMGGKVPNEEPNETIEDTVRRHVNRTLAA